MLVTAGSFRMWHLPRLIVGIEIVNQQMRWIVVNIPPRAVKIP
ncbi:hypothetical protein BH23ACT10_BH23ACT10_32570 [soil metagenome]